MLERHELDAFLTLAEELHFGRTAERLHLSTTRVSQTIARLERRVGVPLFNRTSRRVELTVVGRRLAEEVRPAWSLIAAAFNRAVDAGRGFTGTLDVAFVGAAGGQLLSGAAELFRGREPACEVRIREAQMADVFPWLREGEVDIALAEVPVDEPDVVSGPVLVREARMLAVPSDHPFARRTSLSLEDLARVRVFELPATVPESLRLHRTPRTTPSGRPIERGPATATFNEMLTLIGAGQGTFVVGAQVRRYYARPDVAYVPIDDAPPLEWALLWRADAATARVRAFGEAALHLLGS
ncbi:LysR family transcriptional regulator [Streptomyces longispororuber]|uniref:LysR family transcriptional regulator n=1 Tax=Streptomyces longispororuber TaxID=68230 RepID=UPI00210DA432|nr:LysR substrate-binding domain-containing protein [Streptomyces longispororuber]MCQ4207521.1 LysR substrate-binding domain-containing protein [Streptomyces longispororuber]